MRIAATRAASGQDEMSALARKCAWVGVCIGWRTR